MLEVFGHNLFVVARDTFSCVSSEYHKIPKFLSFVVIQDVTEIVVPSYVDVIMLPLRVHCDLEMFCIDMFATDKGLYTVVSRMTVTSARTLEEDGY